MRSDAIRRAGWAHALLACAALALASCGAGDDDPAPGGVTVGEARALEEAAEMLDERGVPAGPRPGPSPTAETTPAAGTP
ncbi:MAG TPA: hypothetical protein VFS49_02235 [Croceibacterium sp.]|nr:hypothetical protein [Croceibacterium sp.]